MESSKGSIIAQDVCFEVYKFMRENHITYEALAQKMKVSPQAISNQIRLKRPFSWRVAERWAAAFRDLEYPIDASFLVSGIGRLAINPEHDYRTNHSFGYKPLAENEMTTSTTEGKVDDWVRKAILFRREIDELSEKYELARMENESLRKIISDIQKIIGALHAD